MSWHCLYCGSSSTEGKKASWVHAHLASFGLECQVPIVIVFHTECFREMLPNDVELRKTLKDWIKEEQESKKRADNNNYANVKEGAQ